LSSSSWTSFSLLGHSYHSSVRPVSTVQPPPTPTKKHSLCSRSERTRTQQLWARPWNVLPRVPAPGDKPGTQRNCPAQPPSRGRQPKQRGPFGQLP
ncbi:hypothetical protein LEMLEM_LOCUS9647, partial [Lemmus lemmus]